MFACVNGERLFFDVEGAGLVPDGPVMRTKPTLVLLHGGPGFDHTAFKPTFSALADVAQIIYFDHRGNGRSGGAEPSSWTLAQWADDVKGLCEVLGIERPIVFGMSFGGFVAQAYATRYPDHPAKLILASTAAHVDFDEVFAAFERIGGKAARHIAESYWRDPTPELRAKYIEICVPLYRARPSADPNWLKRAMIKNDVAIWFNGPRNEHGRMDFRAVLSRIKVPVLVMAGDRDPIAPPIFSEQIAASLPPDLVRFERFTDCGHGVVPDEPEKALGKIREFILSKP
jgi:pimeloyl-ACP methyl ester carboxylesterase